VASDLTGDKPRELARPGAAAAERPPPPSLQSADSHRTRFRIVYALLALAVTASLVGVVVFALNSVDPAPKWSSWKPSGGGLGAAQQIAARVSGTYHLRGGTQLVDVFPSAPSFSADKKTVPISFVALRGARGQIDEIHGVSPTSSVWYSLCGLGPPCSIPTGTPSLNRGALVRREILELALYTFKYVEGVKHVVAFMPPRNAKSSPVVVYLQKGDVENQLKRPLTSTLPAKVPFPDTLTARDLETIDATTKPHLFSIYDIAHTQQGAWVLALAPILRGTP